ncbi:helix-turn-helix domain-containing protein [Psychroserpens sp.]|uniref:winged helix-turn-helix transcriptional regulator n=1 Tax=Psychroserpens sp. TaxID=2020870 RepID=UPI001B145B01|nr:helix-turn-helix domain-containing protein [Psychroserpens sp.]MBO6606672.1 helix-turn-helix transcriptional regulator [Psychroserpens sp.]MBO6631657.1 helix-turn-helix transcriptional regulator [Psychroserpens sp.]MBO6653376.1 helix-turn-helix transcriptional regulator [Psychroserpens sp.]MBO6680597.1 helix-turn-helix transcriptional regulator [Psychroserpens sp.]MBO6750445.1 helix-turn-helix transcriptional regulator [Psychroserpens sp.]
MEDNNEFINCPLRRALNALGGKWNLIIIKIIGTGELRFGQIKREIPDISEKVLIEKLKVLISYDIVVRKDFKEVPPKVSYRLSETGIKALKIVNEIELFGSYLKVR